MTIPHGIWWRKATRSDDSGHCVEVGAGMGRVHVRDTKDSNSPVLSFKREDWSAFIAGVSRGHLG